MYGFYCMEMTSDRLTKEPLLALLAECWEGTLLLMRDQELSFEYRVLGVQLMSMNGFKINPMNLEKYVYGLYYEIYVHLWENEGNNMLTQRLTWIYPEFISYCGQGRLSRQRCPSIFYFAIFNINNP